MDCDQEGGGRVKQLMLVLLFLSSALLIGLTPVVLEFPSVDATYSYFEEYFDLFELETEFKDLRFLGMDSVDSLLFLGSNSLPTFVTPIGIQGFSIEADLKGELETLLKNTELKVSTGDVFTIKNNHTPAYVWFSYSDMGKDRWILLSLFLVENGLAEYEECSVLREDVAVLLSEASKKAQENLTGQWKVVVSSRSEKTDNSKSTGSTFIYSPAGSSETYSVDSSKYESLSVPELFAALESDYAKSETSEYKLKDQPSYRPEEVIVYVVTSELTDNTPIIRYHEKDCPLLTAKNSRLSQVWLSTAISRGYVPCPMCDPPIVDEKTSEVIFDSHTVYLTSDGKYHRANCPLLEGKEIHPTKLVVAQGYGYTPCTICNPPK